MEGVMPALLQLEKGTNDYLPVAVSFGPHHHGEPNLAFVEAFKPTAVELFAEDGQESKEFYYNKILSIIDELQNCYVQTSIDKYTKHELAQMLLHDAALLIISMELDAYRRMKNYLGRLTFGVLLRDMFLFNNQIPLRVIRLLVDSRDGAGRSDELVHRFSIWCMYGEYREEPLKQEVDDDEPHLLHVYRRLHILGIGKPKTASPTQNRQKKTGCMDLEEGLGLGLRKLFCCNNAAAADSDNLRRFVPVYRAATDLKAKGIYFKPSPTESLSDVTFKYQFLYARLRIPVFTVDRDTKVLFKNMIAYELSPSGPKMAEIAAFVCFIKSLIEKVEDVKELREKKILCNNLGSDEEVLHVLKDINTNGEDEWDIYKNVRDEIGAHCDSKMKTWMAELLHTNFKSPWTMAAFLAAVALLAVTVAQLYYAIHPK